jgi:D-amino-acid oxidase
MKPKVIVVGCGVAGLTSAFGLRSAGCDVEIWARELPPKTTSNIAAAIWYPYAVGNDPRIVEWSGATYRVLRQFAEIDGAGVKLVRGLEYIADREHDDNAVHRAAIYGVREMTRGEVPARFARGFELSLPVVEMPIYLEYLSRSFVAYGGRIVERAVASLDEALEAAPLVVNCTGLGARELCNDREMVAIRGQIVRVERGAVDRFTLDDYDPRGVTYVVPRSRDCVLGGTREEGREDLEPDEAATRGILERCAELDSRLANARVLSVAVGLRPGRSTIRLEREERSEGRAIVHNYGHGGAGVTLSFGCAYEVGVLAGVAKPR